MYHEEDDMHIHLDHSGRSARSKTNNVPPDEYQDQESYNRAQSHPPMHSFTPQNIDGYDKLNRQSSNESGGRTKKLKYENNEDFHVSITASTDTNKMGNLHTLHPRENRNKHTTAGSATILTEARTEKTEKTSSISSSSTGSRRRMQERERQRAWGAVDMEGTDTVDRINTIMEVGGENFVQEFQGNSVVGNSPGGTTQTTSQHSVDHSKSNNARGRANKKLHNSALDWPTAPPDHFMDEIPPREKTPSASSSHHSAAGMHHIDDVQNSQTQMYHQQQAAPALAPTARRAVLHACDDKGRCLFHPHVILRKKAILGVMGGWKDVLPACPECESEDMGGGAHIPVLVGSDRAGINSALTSSMNVQAPADRNQKRQVKFDPSGGGTLDGSERSSRDQMPWGPRRHSSYDSPQEEEQADEDDDSSSDNSSSSSSSSSTSSSEDTCGGRLPPRPSRGAKAIKGGTRKFNKMASGAGNAIKKNWAELKPQKNEDCISTYISSGVPSRSTGSSHRTNKAPTESGRRASDSIKFSHTLSPDNSMDSSSNTPTTQGKKVFMGVSNGVSGLVRKSKKTISKSVKATLSHPSHRGGASSEFNEADFDNFNYSNDDIIYGHDLINQYFDRHDRPVSAAAAAGGRREPSHRNRQRRSQEKQYYHGEPPPAGAGASSNHTRHRRGQEKQYYHGEPPPAGAGASSNHTRHRRGQEKQYYHGEPPPAGAGESTHSKQRRGQEKQYHGDRERPKKDPSGKALVFDGVRVRSQGEDRLPGTERSRRSRVSRKSQADSASSDTSSTRHYGTASMDVEDTHHGVARVPTTTPYSSDVAYQWDRMPFPESDADERSKEESAAEEESVSEEDSHHQRLADVAYQWDRMPLQMETSEIEDPDPEEEWQGEQQTSSEHLKQQQMSHSLDNKKQRYYEHRRSQEENIQRGIWHAAEEPQQQNSRDESLSPTSQFGTGNLDSDTVLDMEESSNNNSRTPSASNSVGSKSYVSVSSEVGLLSMEDLLQSIQEDITMTKLDRTESSHSHSANLNASMPQRNHSGSSSMPQLDRSGSTTRENSSSYMEEEQIDSSENTRGFDFNDDLSSFKVNEAEFFSSVVKEEALKEEGREPIRLKTEGRVSMGTHAASSESDEESDEEEETPKQEDNSNPSPVALAPSSISMEQSDAPIPLPRMGNYGGGLKIDLSALQASKPASKPSKQPETKADEKSEDDDQPNMEELQPPVDKPIIKNVKTFPVNNLPYTGHFGESGMYTGSANEQYEPHGKGTMVYDNGEIMKGYWDEGGLVRESELYSDSEDDDDDDDAEGDDLSSSMANIGTKGSAAMYGRDRSRSRSRTRSTSKDRVAPTPPPPPPPPPKSPSPSPPPPEYKIGDSGKHRDMISDKEEASSIIEQLKFGDGAFIRRSDGKWTYAVVKSLEEAKEGKSAIRFTVNDRNSSKSYGKKYWGTHVRPLKGSKLRPPSPDKVDASVDEREGRAKQREPAGELSRPNSGNAASSEELDRGISCPPTQSRLTFDWPSARHGRSRSRSRRRAVSCSPMRPLTSIAESDVEGEDEDDDNDDD
eukprot:CAMPEP_0172328170 /NCGR_PEP_ID=MMETSP1058-20130122/60213_1 /TAXON_ID=83371 /ORGANISM="Detonula confervacea, Strain CCMP 353" /LENGTH=1554 /DNA_ID=CAMNT_0013045273 /DNA_START=53 /DNA_END=4717 /DNA_ORIENTATION=-